MKVKQESSKIVKPVLYEQGNPPSLTYDHMPLSVFDKVTFDTHVAVIYAYKSPTPNNSSIEQGLQKVLAEFREWAGRFGKDHQGNRVILLNDKGAKFVEASADCSLDQVLPFKPSPDLLNFHPNLEDVEELVQVQLTRFTCGSLVVGFTAHHIIADAKAISHFLLSWGQACRGLEINPRPFHDRTTFAPRDPPRVEFQHEEIEYTSKKLHKTYPFIELTEDDIVVHKAHFTLEFLSKLKAKASLDQGDDHKRPYSTFESLVAHLWRTITKARGLNDFEKTRIRISVNGRLRMNPPIPDYFGNLVLWAFPTLRVKDLLCEPVSFAAKTIHDAVTNVNDNYFKSFIDFSNTKSKEEDLIPSADAKESMFYPNIHVDSWLRFPFYNVDFGGGTPYAFMPSFLPVEGLIFLLPSRIGDGSIDAFIPLFQQNLAAFKDICYSL